MEIVRIDDIRQDRTAAVFVGRDHGANVSFFVISCRRGEGPPPHRHPYEETFVVLKGASEVTVDGETIEVEAGSIVVSPAGQVHSQGSERRGDTAGQHPPGGRDGHRVDRVTSRTSACVYDEPATMSRLTPRG